MTNIIYHKNHTPFYIGKNSDSGYISESDYIPLIRFHCFDEFDWLDAFLTTRLGGVSTGFLASLNLGLGRGDSDENVATNYEIIAKNLGISPERLIKTDQVHTDNIQYIDESVLPCGPLVQKFKSTDGLYTNRKNLALCVSVADCVPIMLVDPVTKTIACVHSGWRGTVLKIGAKGVSYLERLGANPANIVALIGPSICMDNYEVTFDVVNEFKKNFSEAEMKDIAVQTDNIHYQLDLWAACFYYLKNAGISPTNIHFSNICTYENHDLLFSHRYTNGKRGNLNAIMMLR